MGSVSEGCQSVSVFLSGQARPALHTPSRAALSGGF